VQKCNYDRQSTLRNHRSRIFARSASLDRSSRFSYDFVELCDSSLVLRLILIIVHILSSSISLPIVRLDLKVPLLFRGRTTSSPICSNISLPYDVEELILCEIIKRRVTQRDEFRRVSRFFPSSLMRSRPIDSLVSQVACTRDALVTLLIEFCISKKSTFDVT
jgi:hypothetical protein